MPPEIPSIDSIPINESIFSSVAVRGIASFSPPPVFLASRLKVFAFVLTLFFMSLNVFFSSPTVLIAGATAFLQLRICSHALARWKLVREGPGRRPNKTCLRLSTSVTKTSISEGVKFLARGPLLGLKNRT
jgi:hypothetical protein